VHPHLTKRQVTLNTRVFRNFNDSGKRIGSSQIRAVVEQIAQTSASYLIPN
jgi:hypothetical protein